MNVALYAWSGLGDALMALPLLQGLKAAGHDAALAGNESMRPFYNFLAEAGVCGEPLIYQSRTPSSWAARLRDLDILLLPPDAHWKDHKALASFKAAGILARPVLRAALGLKDARFIAEARVKTRSSKAPEAVNLALSYARCLEERFSLPFKKDFLFLPETALERARGEALPRLMEAGFSQEPYAALYRATKGKTRDLPEALIRKISEFCTAKGWRLIEVGGSGPEAPTPCPGVLDWRGQLNFWELAGVFGRARMVFSIDGGLLHLALACRTKTVSVWGPTIPESRTNPQFSGHYALCRYLPFQPYLDGPQPTNAAQAFDFSAADIARAAQALA